VPVIFCGVPLKAPAPPPKTRRRPLDDAARKLASVMAELRSEGIVGVEETVAVLNARGIARPNGKPFTFGATHRLLWRQHVLGLGPRPRTVSQALKALAMTK
jgi:hypothetical protein